MANTTNNSLLLTNPDFTNLRSNFNNFLSNQTQFADYNYVGSNMSVFLDILAFNAYQNAFLTNMVASEMFLDTAQIRSSVVSRAKELGYIPRSQTSAIANLNIIITPNDSPSNIIIPANTMFNSSYGSQSYNFLTTQAYNILPSNGIYTANVTVYEGYLTQDTFTIDYSLSNQQFVLSNQGVDISSIQLTVTTAGNTVNWTQTSTIVDILSTSLIFFVQENQNEYYQILFGDGILGALPAQGSTVTVTYRINNATSPNGCSVFTPASTIAGYSNISIITLASAAGGSAIEDIESIRYYAPLQYQNKGRAITDNDYEVILKDQFNEIKSMHVFDGSDLNPPQCGRTVISATLNSGVGVPLINQNKYLNYISNKMPLSITPIFITPVYLFLKITSTVYYDYTLTNYTNQDIQSAVTTTIQKYNASTLNDFDTTFRYSNLTTLIDATDTSINSDDTTVLLSVQLTVNQLSSSQTINLYNVIDSSNIENPAITSTNFKYNNNVCQLADDGNGIINIQTVVNTGVSNIITKIGTVDYTNGVITLSAISYQQLYGTVLKIYARTASKDISANLNTILAVDLTDINVTVIAQRR